MKIIQVNKFHYLKGGAERCYLEISKKLAELGDEVAFFSMKDKKNLPTKWDKYFVNNLDFDNLKKSDYINLPRRIIYSKKNKAKFNQLLDNFPADIINLHNIYHHISPSILDATKKRGIPIVTYVHDYKLICPNYQLYNNGKILWDCCGKKAFNCFRTKCFKNSYLQSFLVSLEYFIHHNVLDIYKKNIDVYIASSEYIKNTLIRFGFPEEKIVVLYNFVKSEWIIDKPIVGDYLLYFGRLSKEKGIDVLIKSLKKVDKKIKLKIVGGGPEEKKLKNLVKKENLEKQIEFTGAMYGDNLTNVIDKSLAVVIPSLWPENMPFSLFEALSRGKAVLAAKVGGLPEIVEDKKNGLLFEPNNVNDLARAITELDKVDINELSQNSLAKAKKFLLVDHVKKLQTIYKKACSK
jgi:glycosyltransferase involved in cell wall biosynthesis